MQFSKWPGYEECIDFLCRYMQWITIYVKVDPAREFGSIVIIVLAPFFLTAFLIVIPCHARIVVLTVICGTIEP